jgi:hypothetical protein
VVKHLISAIGVGVGISAFVIGMQGATIAYAAILNRLR